MFWTRVVWQCDRMFYCNIISLFKWGPQTPIRFPPSWRSERAALTCIGTDSKRNAKHYYSHSADCTYTCKVQMAFKSRVAILLIYFQNILRTHSKKHDCQVNTATLKKKRYSKNLPRSQIALKVSWQSSDEC